MSDNQGLVDFPVQLLDSVLVTGFLVKMFSGNSNFRSTVRDELLGVSEKDFQARIYHSLSLPKQA